MAFSTFKDLTDTIQRYINRKDEDTLSFIPLWVRMAEDNLDRYLRHPAGEVYYDFVLPAGSDRVRLPENMLGLKQVLIQDTKETLDSRTLETLYKLPTKFNQPTGFAKVSNDLVFNMKVLADLPMTIVFWITPEKLNEPGDRNMYLIQCSDYLLYYAVARGFDMKEEQEKAAKYDALAEKALSDLQELIKREENSGSTLIYWGDLEKLRTYY